MPVKLKKPVKVTLLDRAIGAISPQWRNNRVASRMKYAALQQNGYLVPGMAKKSMKGVVATPNSPDQDMAPKLSGSRALSRDMYMNTPLAVAAIRRNRTNVVGSGLRPKPTLDTDTLGLTVDEAKAWEKRTRAEFVTWADSKFCDFAEKVNFWDSQNLAFTSTLLNGDMFYMLPWKKPSRSGNWPYELRIKLIEADLIRNPDLGDNDTLGVTSKRNVVSGIELDKKNTRIVAAWFADQYTRDLKFTGNITNFRSKRVEKRDRDGRVNWYQLVEYERIGQRRGMPYLAPVIDLLKTCSRHTESELVGALVASTFTVFVKDQSALGQTLNEGFTPTETVGGGGTTTDQEGNQNPQPKDDGDDLDLELGAGTIHYLDDSKDITIADPKRPTDSFEPFFNAVVSQISAALEIPSEQLLMKFTTSYTAARAALLEVWKFYRRRRHWLAREYCQVVYEAFLEEQIVKGRINAPGYFDDPVIKAAWSKCLWIGPGMGQIDPLKESKAAMLAIGGRITTRQRVYTDSNGEDWEDGMEQMSREEKILTDLDLNTNLDPSELTGPDGVEEEEEENNQ